MEKSLEKKLLELNNLKKVLITREENNGEVKGKIENVLEDIELLLNDFGYINVRQKNYTLDELSKYTGENGGQALVAVFGTVYDVSGVAQWQSGMHFGIKAGADVSEYFKTCHSSQMSLLNNFRVVGVLVQ